MNDEEFYGHAKEYWSGISPTVDGMLGGFAHVSSTDIGESNKFLRPYIRGANAKTKTEHALDCGAGIGRITKLFLSTIFTKVDMVELNQEFLDKARNYMGERAQKLDRLFCSGLQDFIPDPGYYDVIWCQWVLGHLTDEDLVKFFQRCKAGLAENGMMIIKENIAESEDNVYDENDSSYTRPKAELLRLIKASGLHIVKMEKQKNFPKELFDVWMIAAN